LADAARGVERDADYFLADEEVRGIERVSGEFNLFSDDRTGRNLRWFRFDEGKNVVFRIAAGGQPGIGEEATGTAVQRAIAAWNGAPGTRIAYAFGGVATGGPNMIRFDNAGDEIDDDFSCSSGGVLGVGGPAYSGLVQPGPNGQHYHPITNGGVTLNKNIECFLQRVPNGLDQLLAHELGHTLGFHHSCGEGLNSCSGASSVQLDALMHPNIHNDARGARLGDDDRAAARALYPGSGDGGGGGGAPVAAPSELAATAISSTQVELTWSDNSDDETQFRIEARPAGGSFARVATTGANATGATVGGLSPDTAYDFRVQARRGGAASPFSPAASATTLPDAPATPGSLAAASLTADGVTLTWSDESGDEIGFAVEARTPSTEGWSEIAVVPPGTTELTLALPTGVPHSFRVRALGTEQPSEPSEVVSVTPEAPDAPCGGDPTALCLGQRFRVTVDWNNPHGDGFGVGTGAAFAGDQSGTFWFFDPANVELIVKILDGTTLNDHFWIFHGALTDVEYWISVHDTATGRSRTYYNPPFDQCGQLDTAGIPGGEELPAAAGNALIFPNPTPAAVSGAATECGDDDTLCLLGGRFEIEVDWVNQHAGGETGVGHRVAGTDQTGYFWFFDPANVELVVKALDARAVNGRFWVFFGSLSDVEYTVTVTDTETLQQRTYVNTPGSTCGQFDTAAFPIDTGALVAPAP
ncbi:MAG TPA: fibronectin type III domain-containing protein, partial [Thermoanaerobaculia bacterium]|nr:fibronectin type III domain-containing protein [Thermoanaerobaculia bacterium]